jgi:release factor glutamine methyltransferase
MRSRTTKSAGGSLRNPPSDVRAAPVAPSRSVRSELARGEALLADAGCQTPRLDAELLLASALGVDRARLVIDASDPVEGSAAAGYEKLLARRSAREPVAYILGEKAFRRIVLAVDRRVLIPRPETELLVEVGLGLVRGTVVADVGTGTGAVALALKSERPDLRVRGIDCSDAALAVARANGLRLGLDVTWARADLLDDCPYEAVLANLPYVADRCALPPEVALYEPAGALFGGHDGLQPIRRLAALLARRPGVSLVGLEVGLDQADGVSRLVTDAGFESISRLRDLAGFERVVVGRR